MADSNEQPPHLFNLLILWGAKSYATFPSQIMRTKTPEGIIVNATVCPFKDKTFGDINSHKGLKKVVELILIGSGYQIHHKDDECLKGKLSLSGKIRRLLLVKGNEMVEKDNIFYLFS